MNFNLGSYGLSSLFGSSSSSSFYSSLGDYASIRTGNYKRLLKSYYAKMNASENGSSAKKSSSDVYRNMRANTTVADQGMTAVKSDTDDLAKSAGELLTKGYKSLFNEKDITITNAETGEKTTAKSYDMDAIAKAVKSFVSDYNSVVKSGAGSSNSNVVRNTQYMTKQTSIYKNSLSDVGITIGDDNTLSLDEEKLKSANIETLKRVFNGSTSFAAQTANRSRSIGQAAVRAASTATTYGSTGRYNFYNNYASSYNWYF